MREGQYIPSNGTEGMSFVGEYCDNCIHEKFNHTQKDGDKQCEILSDSFWKWPEGVKEWKFINGEARCTAHVHWDWNQDDNGDWNDPVEPDPINPDQLMMPFSIWELLGIQEDILVTKTVVTERALI